MSSVFELKLDTVLAEGLIKQQTKIHPSELLYELLIDPDLTQEQGIEKIIQRFRDKYPEQLSQTIQNTQKVIDHHNIEIQKIESDIKKEQEKLTSLKQQIIDIQNNVMPLYNQLLSMFPPHRHEIINNYFDDSNYLLNMLYTYSGFWAKTFQKSTLRKKFFDLYDKIKISPLSQIGYLEKEIATQQRIIQIKESRLATQKQQIPTLDYVASQHNEYNLKMHTAIAQFVYAHTNRSTLRKNIPPILNSENLTEPVSFSRIITDISKSQLEKILKHAGLPVGYGPSEYIVRNGYTLRGKPCLELITPFYSPNMAKENISTLLQYLASYNVRFEGVVVPATYRQINPQPAQQVRRAEAEHLIRKKLQTAISRESFCQKYNQTNNQFVFRGQSFMTSDISSSYATPTWRPGRTGIAYATGTPFYATTYATTSKNQLFAGQTMATEYIPTIDNYTVGLVTVFKTSPDNIFVADLSLEDIESNCTTGPGNLYNETTGHQFNETIVSPQKNPVHERYMIIGDKMMLIDENDPEWRTIMNSLAPDLSVTHIYGPSKQCHGLHPDQQMHGREFIKRLNQLESQFISTGHVQTYDIPQEILEKIEGTHTKKTAFNEGAQHINKKPHQNTVLPSIINSNEVE